MFDFSFSELLVVAVVTLVVLGPKEIPVVLRYVRGIIRSLRETSDSIRKQIDEVLEMDHVHSG
jgi:sec-independent protein translocase protein TatB